MTRPTISAASPFFIVANVTATLAFYRDMLGFEVVFRGPTPDDEFFGIVRRDGAMIMFKALGEIVGVRFSVPLADNDDGLRGFVIEDIDGYGLYFGCLRT
jgi:catechol 2,3-dioxygenase-like lactoylglutathione lyase family enzyme